MYNALMEMPY